MLENKATEIVLIKRKKKKNIINEIYLYGRTLVKRFVKIAPLPDTRRIWEMEDTALRRLEGLPVPRTYGYTVNQLNGAKEIIYAREYLEGTPVKSFSDADMEPLARLVAKVHQRGVITRDPSLENFIKTPGGNILFIDFGRSIIFNPKNPVILDYMGKELARLWCHAFAGNEKLYSRFQDKYFEILSPGPARRFLIEEVSFKWYRKLNKKHISGVN